MSFWRRLLFWRRNQTADVVEELGFIDLALPMRAHEITDDGIRRFEARGELGGRTVGVVVELHPDWSPWELEEHGITFWRGIVTYASAGAESDEFVRRLAALYRLPLTVDRMKTRVTFAAVALNGEPTETLKDGVMIKLFYESDSEDRYAEIFTNIYPGLARVEFREKDSDYRAAVLRALTEPD